MMVQIIIASKYCFKVRETMLIYIFLTNDTHNTEKMQPTAEKLKTLPENMLHVKIKVTL